MVLAHLRVDREAEFYQVNGFLVREIEAKSKCCDESSSWNVDSAQETVCAERRSYEQS